MFPRQKFSIFRKKETTAKHLSSTPATKVFVKLAVSRCWGCDKDAEIIAAIINRQENLVGKFEIQITVDELPREGQYIIAYVTPTVSVVDCSPVFNFPEVQKQWSTKEGIAYNESIEEIYHNFVGPAMRAQLNL